MPARDISASLEDYLEAIHAIVSAGDKPRVKAIAAQLGVRASSVTAALHQLAERRLVDYVPYGAITLTPRGIRTARDVAGRHHALRAFFGEVLGVEPDLADATACRVEHTIPPELHQRLSAFIAHLRDHPGCVAAFHRSLAAPDAREGTP
ncbi:MAG: metal-dependent transcriptional regulator [Planctomycetota bacterium]